MSGTRVALVQPWPKTANLAIDWLLVSQDWPEVIAMLGHNYIVSSHWPNNGKTLLYNH